MFNFVTGGWNNNPTVQSFRYTMRRMLVHCGQLPSKTGNVGIYYEEMETEVPSERIESLSSQLMKELDSMTDHGYHKTTAQLQKYETSSLGYMAG